MSNENTMMNARGAEQRPAFPTRVLQAELGSGSIDIDSPAAGSADIYEQGSVLVRLHGEPLGLLQVDLREGVLDADALRRRIWSDLRSELVAHLRADGVGVEHAPDQIPLISRPACVERREAANTSGPRASVIIVTHDRPVSLLRTLKSILALEYTNYEIIVVDNAPGTPGTRDMLESRFGRIESLRYVAYDVPGATPARIRGIECSEGAIIAFADDDVVVDRFWLSELVAGFGHGPSVACVTGLTLPLALDTFAQVLFEEYGGFGRGFSRRTYDMHEHRPSDRLFPYAIGRVGSGNNVAWDRKLFSKIGGFDPALSKIGAEDISAFFDALNSGFTIVYQPAAIVFHEHRSDFSQLRNQVYWYGIGLGGYLARCLTKDTMRFVTRIPFGLVYLLSSTSSKNAKKSRGFPQELTRLERRGVWRGAALYIRARMRPTRVLVGRRRWLG
jgi:GT2 family glycosyltransferase